MPITTNRLYLNSNLNIYNIYMCKRLFSVALLLCIMQVGLGQEAAQSSSGGYMKEYNRNSLTMFLVESGRYSSELKSAMKSVVVPEKFDDNMLSVRSLPPMSSSDAVKAKLESMNVPKEIFEKWFSRNSDGRFSMSVIHERGLYNATDADVLEASASKLGLAKLQDAGEKLIRQSYVMVIRFGEIKTMEQIYNEQDANRRKTAQALGIEFIPTVRVKSGYRAEVTGYLFKLADVSETMNDFYSNMWIFDDDDPSTMAEKRRKFDSTPFKLSYVTSVTTTVEATEPNMGNPSGQSVMLRRLLNNSVDGLVSAFENQIEEWKVRTALYSTFPLRAKIGTKENLQVEDRYFVYEYRMDRHGQVTPKRRGVIRAKKVVNNSHVAEGSSDEKLRNITSKFYQVAGHKLEPGMFLEQSNDMGCGVTFGAAVGSLGGIYINGELLLGQYIGLTQFKFFMGGHFGGNTYDLTKCGKFGSSSDFKEASFAFYGGEIGFSKGFFVLRNLSLSGHFGLAMEWADALESEVKKSRKIEGSLITGTFGMAGAQAAINLRYNCQLVGGATYYAELGNAKLSSGVEDEDTKDLGVTYSEVFEGRAGVNINFGVRIQF